ncbi:MAG: hypothetical protein R2729_22405 [Bryobacteraceae bacterium]
MTARLRTFLPLLLAALAAQSAAQEPGAVLPPWTEGTLDIHHINTGKGNATLFLLPDGTRMMFDAGWGGPDNARGVAAKPDSSRNPGEWIARYARRAMTAAGLEPELDYAALSHFHGDHMGGIDPRAKAGKGGYKLTGITEVGEHLRIRRMLDRGWPSYDFPAPLKDPMMANYRAFLQWQIENGGMRAERFEPGRNDQIVLVRNRAKYPEFEVRNVLANTVVWTGVANNTRQNWPDFAGLKPNEMPGENPCSMGFRMSYGKFDYASFGDIPGVSADGSVPPWQDMETPVARAVGPVEALLVDHHGNRDSQNAFFVSTLRPQVFLIHVWSSDHPGHDVLARMLSTALYPGPRDVFATNMAQANRDVIGPLLDRLKSAQGHVVLRVAPGGGSFRVIVLDDTAETFQVKAVFGPYQSR